MSKAADAGWDPKSQSVVLTNSKKVPVLSFNTIRLSPDSHPYRSWKNYAGFILYGLKKSDGEVLKDWKLNGKHFKSAEIVIQDTDSEAVKRYIGHAQGQVHGAVYWNVFGEGTDVTRAIGEGFSLRNGNYNWKSYTLNANADSYHDHEGWVSSQMEKCVRKILEDWRRNSSKKIYTVKELLEA